VPNPSPARRALAVLRRFALAYPEAREDYPWGERVAKVRGKVFVFFGVPGDGLHVSVKLPESGLLALGLPFAAPTGYGLGKSGWVSARFGRREKPPVELLKSWIDESYRAVAPKALVADLPSRQRSLAVRGSRRKARRRPGWPA
jgi:predicted DNA-binding protein (MmcQ/YjbR family)